MEIGSNSSLGITCSQSTFSCNNGQFIHSSCWVKCTSIESKGANVIFLPPYSPDLNPLESVFDKVKTVLKENDSIIQATSTPLITHFNWSPVITWLTLTSRRVKVLHVLTASFLELDLHTAFISYNFGTTVFACLARLIKIWHWFCDWTAWPAFNGVKPEDINGWVTVDPLLTFILAWDPTSDTLHSGAGDFDCMLKQRHTITHSLTHNIYMQNPCTYMHEVKKDADTKYSTHAHTSPSHAWTAGVQTSVHHRLSTKRPYCGR